MTPNTRTLKGQSYCSQRWANPAWPKGSKSRGFSTGNVIKGVRQTYGVFTAPVESFEHGAKTGHIFINDNPINAYCFGNAVLDSDRLENCKPIKRKPRRK